MRLLELLAPARNADIGIAAIGCGADAVYIAGPGFGARQAAGNPMSEVAGLCGYAHRFGARIFLTLNTILFDDELPEAERILREAAEAGVDAVIAQDLAVFGMCRGLLPVHASTQCAIRTPEQARFYESLGATRLILERELSLEQVREIREAVSCELEFFVHGALCVCYSGQCYMSEAIAGRSANRGACIQACRSLYDLVDGDGKVLVKDKALLSLKDYNLMGRLGDLAEAGVDSFKVEGRLKNISYVRNVVRAYSEALDRLVEAHPDLYRRASFGRVTGGFTPDLAKTFNRGYTELFLDGKRGQWSSMDAPKSIGEPVGRVVGISSGRPDSAGSAGQPRRPGRVHPRFAAAEYGLSRTAAPAKVQVQQDNPGMKLENGDGFAFVSKEHNEIIGFRADTCEGNVITCKDVLGLYVGARLYRNLSTAFEKELERNLSTRLIPVEVGIEISEDKTPSMDSSHDGLTSRYLLRVNALSQDGRDVSFEVGAGSEAASNTERMRGLFASQLSKATGIYSFNLESLDVRTADGSLPFMPASALNAIRRELASRFDTMPCASVDHGHHTSCPARPGIPDQFLAGHPLSYKANIANSSARALLQNLGAGTIEPAFELTHREGVELMRTKYCIRHELGLCPKQARESAIMKDSSAQGIRMTKLHQPGDLYLLNNGRRYPLRFDCRNCEMVVLQSSPHTPIL